MSLEETQVENCSKKPAETKTFILNAYKNLACLIREIVMFSYYVILDRFPCLLCLQVKL